MRASVIRRVWWSAPIGLLTALLLVVGLTVLPTPLEAVPQAAAAADSDADGIPDDSDWCIFLAGPGYANGCAPGDLDTSSTSDFNGDGRSDVLAYYDYGSAITGGFQFFGQAGGGITGANEMFRTSAGGWDFPRTRLVTGDFNGDGKSDAAVFYQYNNLAAKGWEIFGTSSGLTPSTIEFFSANEGGWDLARTRFVAGDINGDGFCDLTAFYGYDGGNTTAYHYFGTANGLTKGGISWVSSPGGWTLKQGRLVGGDFNGDGRYDVAGFYDYGGSNLKIWMFWGQTNGTFTVAGPYIESDAWDMDRTRMVSGDFNRDGKSDVMAFYDLGGAATQAYLFSGSSGGLLNSGQVWVTGAGAWDLSRTRLVSGDSNGDKRDDVIAFYGYDGFSTSAYLFAGNGSSISPPTLLWNTGAGNWNMFGSMFAGGAATIYKPPPPPPPPPAPTTPPPPAPTATKPAPAPVTGTAKPSSSAPSPAQPSPAPAGGSPGAPASGTPGAPGAPIAPGVGGPAAPPPVAGGQGSGGSGSTGSPHSGPGEAGDPDLPVSIPPRCWLATKRVKSGAKLVVQCARVGNRTLVLRLRPVRTSAKAPQRKKKAIVRRAKLGDQLALVSLRKVPRGKYIVTIRLKKQVLGKERLRVLSKRR